MNPDLGDLKGANHPRLAMTLDVGAGMTQVKEKKWKTFPHSNCEPETPGLKQGADRMKNILFKQIQTWLSSLAGIIVSGFNSPTPTPILAFWDLNGFASISGIIRFV